MLKSDLVRIIREQKHDTTECERSDRLSRGEYEKRQIRLLVYLNLLLLLLLLFTYSHLSLVLLLLVPATLQSSHAIEHSLKIY